jgi:hypothetical protein
MSSLHSRIQYLGLADFDYLSARLLVLCGLPSTGLPKASEAFEKLLKLLLMLEAKIRRNEELTPRQLKAYGHDLTKLFSAVKATSSVAFKEGWDVYFETLKEAYGRRYPEHWTSALVEINVNHLDAAYAYFRNNVVDNLPEVERERARVFGTDYFAAYTPDVVETIRSNSGVTIGDVLRSRNQFLQHIELNWDALK